MRYRRLGRSDLEVSEVGFGVWTIATDWWGAVDDKAGLVHAALDAGINFFDTAPAYGEDGFGERILAELLGRRDDVLITTKCGYDIHQPRIAGQSERPQDWSPAGVRHQVEDSLRRLDRDHIDLLQLHNVRIDPVRDDGLWDELGRLRDEGKVRELGVSLGPAIGWVQEGIEAVQLRDIVALQTVFNILEQEPGLTFTREEKMQDGQVGMIARVPHASDVLSGKITRDAVFAPGDHRGHRNTDNMLDNFEKADRLEYLWAPETGRTIGQAAVAGILAFDAFTCVLPTCVNADEVRQYAAASDVPLTADEKAELDSLWSRNFDHEDRFVMPLKSSV